jgi:glyoxylate reductase
VVATVKTCFYSSTMTDKKRFRIFATSRIGDPAENRLRQRGYDLEVFQGPEAPPKKLIIEKVKSGIDGLITTLCDPIDAEIFEAGTGSLKVVAQIAVGFDNINRADANNYKVPFTNTAASGDLTDVDLPHLPLPLSVLWTRRRLRVGT